VIQIPRGGGPSSELTSLSSEVWGFDQASNGDLYVDQVSRPMEILTLKPDGGDSQTILMTDTYVNTPGLVLPDGQVLFTSEAGGRRRVMAVRAGQNPTPLFQGSEETSGPLALVGKSEVAFLIGSEATRQLAIASTDGRSVRRLEKADGRTISSIAATPDGKTLYYAAGGTSTSVWAIDSGSGETRRIQAGSSVALDPQGNLIVQIVEKDSVRLERVPSSGGQAQPLSFSSFRLAPMPLTSNAVRGDGAIIKNISTPDSWLWSPVILFPDTGKVQRIPLSSFLDVHYAGWAPGGRVALFTLQTQASLWGLRPAGE
jgi:WD40 repeat protein